MLGIGLVIILALYLAFLYPIFRPKTAEAPRSEHYDIQMKKLWNAAQTSMRDHKPLRAEKALLTILKFDEKNAAAYNRLGILYAKEQKFSEAIECFEIAQSLDNNPSSLHNVGLIYLETGAHEKAAMAFEQAIDLEPDVPTRFIALAKAKERLGQTKGAIDALEHAYSLDRSVNTLRQILAIYEAAGDTAALADITARIETQIAEDTTKKAPVKRRPRTAGKTAAPTSRTVARKPRTTATSRPRTAVSNNTPRRITASASSTSTAAPRPRPATKPRTTRRKIQ